MTKAPPIPRLPEGETRLVPFAEAKEKQGCEPLCDGWLILGIRTFAQLVETLREMQAKEGELVLLASLDQRYQADYTSGQAVDSHDLDRVVRADAPDAPEEWFEGESDGFAEGPESFPFRLRNLQSKAHGVTLDQLNGLLPWSDPDVPGGDLVSLNTQPDVRLMLDKEREVEIQRVPVSNRSDALAAFPNGYFHFDLDPMQNYTLAKALEERHGLGMFGVGASTMGFWREDPIDADEAAQVAALLVALYRDTPADGQTLMAQAVTGKREVLYRYTES